MALQRENGAVTAQERFFFYLDCESKPKLACTLVVAMLTQIPQSEIIFFLCLSELFDNNRL